MKLTALIASLALVASPALADPLVLLCQGRTVIDSGDGQLGAVSSWKYYKIDVGYWSEWTSSNPTWSRNLCPLVGAKCSIGATVFQFLISGDGFGQQVTINRQTGTVSDYSKTDTALGFTGTCEPAADPFPAGAPNKF